MLYSEYIITQINKKVTLSTNKIFSSAEKFYCKS